MSKLLKSFLIINSAQVLYVLSGYFIHAYLGRLLDPSDYGRYGLIITLATMTIVFIGDGVPKALAKFISQFPEKEKIIKRKSAILQTLLVAALTLIYYFSSPLIAAFFKDETLIPLIQMSALIIPAFAAASFYNNYYNGLRLFKMQAFQTIVRSVVRIFAILVLAYFYGIAGAILGYIVAPALVALIAFLADKNRKNPIVGDFPYKKIIRFASGVVSFMVAYNLVINVDLFLTKRILSDDYLLGIYNAVITIGRIPFYFFSNLAFILLPTVSNILEKRTLEEARMLIKKSIRFLIMLILPTAAAIMLYSEEIITLLYSKTYIDGSLPLKIFVFGVSALTIFFVSTAILNGSDNVQTSAILTWIGLAVNVVLNYLLIPKYGLMGSAFATALSSFVLMTISLVWVSRFFGNILSFGSLARSILATLITTLIFLWVPKSIILMFPGGIFFFFFYFLILTLIGEMSTEDRKNLKGLIWKKSKVIDNVE